MARERKMTRANRYPWGTYSYKLKWWSPDPNEPTWCRAIHSWEDDYRLSQEECVAQFGISVRQMQYVYARWDRFRRGLTVMPTVNPLAAILAIHAAKQKR